MGWRWSRSLWGCSWQWCTLGYGHAVLHDWRLGWEVELGMLGVDGGIRLDIHGAVLGSGTHWGMDTADLCPVPLEVGGGRG